MSEVLCANGLAAAEKNDAGALATATGRASSDTLYFVGTALGLFVTMAFLTALAISVRGGLPWFILALLLTMTLAGAALFTTFATQAWSLRRHVGMFVFDPRTRRLTHRGGDSYSFDDVLDVRASSRFAAETRTNANVGWWLLVDTKTGPTLRIYRGSWKEVRLVADALREMGLPIEGDLREEDGVLLRTSHCLVRRDDQGRLVLENQMRTFKLVSPFIITVWLLFSAGYFYSLAKGNWCVLPFCLFFAFGIGVGSYNLFQTYRRAGIYVFDPKAKTLSRDGDEREGWDDLESITLGAVSFRGMRENLMGPTAVAAVRRDGTLWLLHTGGPGDVRYVGEEIAALGLTVREAGKEGLSPTRRLRVRRVRRGRCRPRRRRRPSREPRPRPRRRRDLRRSAAW